MHDDFQKTPFAVIGVAAPGREIAVRPVTFADGRRRVRLRAFCWAALSDAAAEQDVPVEALIGMIDGRRGTAPLPRAAERFVAAYFRARAATTPRRPGLQEERPLLDEVLDRLD